MNRLRIILIAIVIATAAALLPLTAADASSYCGITWGSLTKGDLAMGTGEVDGVRTGQHACYDRVVIDIDGPAAGYLVQYVSQVTADGSGAVVPTPGKTKLQLMVRHPKFSGTVGQSVANVSGYRTLQSVVYAGSFEGQTTYGIGLRHGRVPFRVLKFPGTHGKIIVDIAHKW